MASPDSSRRNIVVDTISKIEGNAGLEVVVEGDSVKDLRFKITDYRRFLTVAARNKRMTAVPSFLSRICGTCSVAHLFASLMAIESSQGIEVSGQTKALRRLAYDGLMILIGAIERAGSADPGKLRDEIEKTKGFMGTGGVFNMSPEDHMGLDLGAFRMLEIRNGDWTLAN